MKKLILLFSSFLAISACSSPEAAEITFLGISSGTLTTAIDDLEFKDRFNKDEKNLVALVAFGESVDETDVQATWFSPDDRKMPLGRKSITMESGATIARFSFASTEDWQASPFMVDIRTRTGEGEDVKTSDEQLHFFVGLDENKITAYWDEFNSYKEHEAEKQRVYAMKREMEEKAKEEVRMRLKASVADIVHRYDVNGDGEEELIIIDPPLEEPFMGAEEEGAVFAADVSKFSISNLSGATVLETREEKVSMVIYGIQGPLETSVPKDEEIHLVLYPEYVTISWEEDELSCSQEFTFDEDWVEVGGEKVCE